MARPTVSIKRRSIFFLPHSVRRNEKFCACIRMKKRINVHVGKFLFIYFCRIFENVKKQRSANAQPGTASSRVVSPVPYTCIVSTSLNSSFLSESLYIYIKYYVKFLLERKTIYFWKYNICSIEPWIFFIQIFNRRISFLINFLYYNIFYKFFNNIFYKFSNVEYFIF